MSSPTPATPALEPLWLRLVRGVVALSLALALTVIAALFIFGYIPAARAAFEPLFRADPKAPKAALTLAILFFIFVPVLLLFWPLMRRAVQSGGSAASGNPALHGRERRGPNRWLNWIALAAGWVVVLPVLAWLWSDDPAVRQPVSIEEFSPGFPGAEQSYAVLMQYSKQAPSAEARALAAVTLVVPGFGASPQDAAKWVEFVTTNRAGLGADWAVLAPQRRWLDELNAFDRIGDLTPAVLEADIVKFQPWRALSYHACGVATLQALDGHGDEAMATLLPLLEVSRKLQLSSRTLVRSLMAEVAERMTLETAAIVLDHAALSPATRARFAAALANENAQVLARRLIMVDYVQFAPLYFSARMGDAFAPGTGFLSILRRPLNLLSGLLLNPNATMNLYGDHVRELAALAEARELRQFATRNWSFGDETLFKPGIKNLGGRLMVNAAIPTFDKVIETHWKIADLRADLRKRLAPPL